MTSLQKLKYKPSSKRMVFLFANKGVLPGEENKFIFTSAVKK
jgi:hypothetical protein